MSNAKSPFKISRAGAKIRKRPKKSQLNIVGMSYGYHDSACCVLQDGEVLAAVQEERFTRIKNDKSIPRRAFRSCLDEAGITIADVDCIAYYEDPCLKLGRQIWMGLVPNLPHQRREAILDRIVKSKPQKEIRRVFGFDGPIEIVDHHLSHAASTYFFSGFEEAAILTVDAVGDWPATTYNSGKGAQIERFGQVDFPDSLGFFYSAVTGYLGFEVNEGEYKVMGLAPYGEPNYVDALYRLIQTSDDGHYELNMDYFAFLTEDRMYTEELCTLLGKPPREPESQLEQFHMDVAKSVQVVLEEVLLEKVRYLYERAPSENLCMAGGVALNVVANHRCLTEGPFERLFVQPAAGDAGGAVGAAAMAYVRMTDKVPLKKRMKHVYLGPQNSVSETHHILTTSGAEFLDYRGKEEELIRCTVDRLLEGKVIGWCHGRMEFGPRALGSRSILADPRRPEMRDKINAVVKMREAFRPFAPAILESEVSEHFELDHSSPFMLETCEVISQIDLPAITHIDGSARIQTVNSETSPRFSALLMEFHQRTGCPILLNTSFNQRGEPIVCSTFDAMMCFVRSQIDVIVVEDFVLDRSGIPPMWDLQAQHTANERGSDGEVDHLVYTLL